MSSCSRLPAGPKVCVRWKRIAFLTSSGASLSTTQYDHISVLSGPLGCHNADHVPGEIRRYVGEHRRHQAWPVRQLGANAFYQLVEMFDVVITYNALGY